MAQEMTFAQALSEARQIIVQQSSRIKSDLEKIVALQDTIASQSTTISQNDRTIKEQSIRISEQEEQMGSLSARVEEMTTAREQAEAVVDRQGQRLTKCQSMIEDLERTVAEQLEKIDSLSGELDSLRQQLPTQEDTDALLALSDLLSHKKVSVPAVSNKNKRLARDEEQPTMRLTAAA